MRPTAFAAPVRPALAQSLGEARYRALVETSSDLVWTSSATGELVEPQPAWLAYTGQSTERMLGWGWIGAVHPDDRAKVAAAWADAVARGSRFAAEFRIRRRDGEFRLTSVRAAPVRSNDGTIVEWVGMNTDVTEQRAAEAALERGRELTARSFAVSPSALVISRVADGTIVEANERFVELFGVPREALVGARSTDLGLFAEPADRDRATGLLKRDGRVRDFELVVRLPSGEARTVLLSVEPLEAWGEGLMLTSLRDITGHLRLLAAEKRARERAEELQALAASLSAARTPADVALATLQAGARATDLRQGSVFVVADRERPGDTLALVEAIGYDESLLAGWRRIPNTPDTPAGDAVARRVPIVIGRRAEIASRYPAMRPLLEAGYAGAAVFPLFAGAPESAPVIGFVGFDFDRERDLPEEDVRFLGALAQLCGTALERARLFETEQQSRARLLAVFDTVPVGIVIARAPSGRIVGGNRQVETILGHAVLPTPGVDGYRQWQAYHPDGRRFDTHEHAMTRALAGEERPDVQLVYQRPDGTSIPLRAIGAPIRDGDGRVTGALVAIIDVTHERAALETLREADRRKDEFLAMLAHELRNPLAPIVNAHRVLEKSATLGVPERTALAMAQRQTVQLRRLVDDLLEVTRITQGKIELRPEPITAGTAIYQAADSLAHEFAARRHELSIELPARPVQIVADPVRLSQILENLLHNACKYTPDGGRIRVVLGLEPHAVEIRVIDNGFGIAATKIPMLFELFQQLEVSIDRAQGGLGVGLTMVKRLVEMHGGTVSAESEGVGCGCCFVVRLPTATASGGPTG